MSDEYAVTTIGDLPVGWSPVNDVSSGVVAGPPRPLASAEESVSGPLIALVVIGSVLGGALGLWALRKWA